MPELPEIETVKRALSPIVDQSITAALRSNLDLRWNLTPADLLSLQQDRIIRLDRRGRHLLIILQSGRSLLCHLGMSGWIRHEAISGSTPLKHDHFTLQLTDGTQLVLNDTRRFGGVMLSERADAKDLPIIANLGLEPFDPQLNPQKLKTLYNGSHRPIKELLMDNALITGIGNIYASEILFQAHIHPDRPGSKINLKQAQTLFSLIQKILSDAIASGGSTLRDFKHTNGESGKAQNLHLVYAKEDSPCSVCSSLIQKSIHGGRSTFFCKKCQKK